MQALGRINAEIKALERVCSKVPPRSFFNDDNVAAIRAQVRVLREVLDDPGTDLDEIEERHDGDTHYLRGAVLDVLAWLREEDGAEVPSEGWNQIVRKHE